MTAVCDLLSHVYEAHSVEEAKKLQDEHGGFIRTMWCGDEACELRMKELTGMTVSAFDGVDKKAKPERSLLESVKKNAGRNSYGHITVRHRGGGNKRKYRIIDFRRDKLEMTATVVRVEYDPNRSAFIALVKYEDSELRYILAPNGLKAGDVVVSSAAADIKPGNCLPLANVPVGTIIHNIELYPGRGAQLVRSAGAAAQLMAKDGDMAQIRLPSGEVRLVRTNCTAVIGQVGNLDHADPTRWRGSAQAVS